MGARWLIATDLDGTLFDHTLAISPRVRRTLAAAQAAGHAVTLATGRMYRATRGIADELAIDQPLICYQGALLRGRDEVLHHLTLPLAVAHDAVRFAEERAIHVNAYLDDHLYVAVERPEAAYYTKLSSVPAEPVGDLVRFLTREPTKIVFIWNDEEEASQMLDVATARWGEQAQVVRSHPRFVELTHPAASKGAALLHLAGLLGIPQARTLAVGDNQNDVAMIRAAGVGVAVGNAVPALKEAANWVAPPLWEDGLAAAIERFVLDSRD